MSDSGLDTKSLRTPEQARRDIARADRQSWFPIGDGVSSYYLIGRAKGGRNVALACSRADRDTILTMARSHDAMVDALQNLLNGYETHMIDSPADDLLANAMKKVRAALALARGEKPTDEELARAGSMK